MTTAPQDLGRDIVLHALSAIRTLQTHGADNRALEQALERLTQQINVQLTNAGGALRLDVVDDALLLNGERIRAVATLQAEQQAQLVKLFQDRQLGGVAFLEPVTPASLRQWLEAFARRPDHEAAHRALHDALGAMASVGIVALAARTLNTADPREALRVSTMAFAMQTYARTMLSFRDFLVALGEGRDPYANRLNVVRAVQDLIDVAVARADFLFHILALQKMREIGRPYAETHAANTCVYAIMLGQMLRLERTALLDLGTAALLAEVPEAAVADQSERARILSPAERTALHADMTRAVQSMLQASGTDDAVMIRAIGAYEHLRPFLGGAEPRLHPFSRLTAVAGAYDALTQLRPWRVALSPQDALATLRAESPARFDPLFVSALATLLEAYLGVA